MGRFDEIRDALNEADRRLTATGEPFETTVEEVLGQPTTVFRHRPRSVKQMLDAASTFADRDCFVFSDGRRLTFADLGPTVALTAEYLKSAHGIEKGDRVAVCAPNSIGWLLTLLASMSLGAVTVGMNGWWSELEMKNALELTTPKVVFAEGKPAARLRVPYVDLSQVPTDASEPSTADLDATALDEDDPAILLFTSGTTGLPKAATLSHRNLVAFSMMQEYLSVRSASLVGVRLPAGRPPSRLAAFPLFHVSGLGSTLSALRSGATTVWPLGRFDPAEVIDLTVRENVNVWGGTMTHILRLLDHPDIVRVNPATLMSVGIGGSATTPQLVRRTEEQFPHLTGTFSSGYGSTESGGLISWTPNALLSLAPDCVGPVLPGIEVRVTGDDGNALPDGQEGDIWVRSALVMLGYWDNEPANSACFTPDRWLRTGDFGRQENHVLFLAARRRDLIIRGGENIYPFEIENRLEEHPDVVEAAVIGVDHEILGQEVKAIVVTGPESPLDAELLRAHCSGTLASYKIPAHFDIRTDPLPRTVTGKVLKHILGDAEVSPQA